MSTYVVVFDAEVSDAEEVIKEHYPEDHYRLVPGRVWAISAKGKTGADICKTLGINTKGQRGGVVIGLLSYYGYFDEALWQKLRLWQSEE